MQTRRLLPLEVRELLNQTGDAYTRLQLQSLLELVNALDEQGLVALDRALLICTPIGSSDPLSTWRGFTKGLRERIAKYNESQSEPILFELTADSKRGDPSKRQAWFEGQPVASEMWKPAVRGEIEMKIESYSLKLDQEYGKSERKLALIESSITDRRVDFPVHLMVDPNAATASEVRAFVDSLRQQLAGQSDVPIELTSAFDHRSGSVLSESEWQSCTEAYLVIVLDGISDIRLNMSVLENRVGHIAYRTAQSEYQPQSTDYVLFSPRGDTYEDLLNEQKWHFIKAVSENIRNYCREGRDAYLTRMDKFLGQKVEQSENSTPDILEIDGEKRLTERIELDVKVEGKEPVRGRSDKADGAEEHSPGLSSQHLVEPPSTNAKTNSLDATGGRQNGIDRLLQWATDAAEPQFCALLGDLGMGKTTTSRMFARDLLKKRSDGQRDSYPLSIYVDLREIDLSNPHSLDSAETILASWLKGEDAVNKPTAEELHQLMKMGDCLVIWDGLDEILSKLKSSEQRRLFMQRLLGAVELRPLRDERLIETLPERPYAKMLLTCRTHYFANIREELSTLTGNDRQGITRADILRLSLQPFSEEQVNEYIRRNYACGNKDLLDNALEVINSLYNLRELAERPLTLRYIVEDMPWLRQQQKSGGRVSIVVLYDRITERWVDRDDFKHQIIKEHKLPFMEDLAWEMWRTGESAWNAEKLGRWFKNQLQENPDLMTEYVALGSSADSWRDTLERLRADLRNATFVARGSDDEFRFAHTSFSEYFLARRLKRALLEGASGQSEWERLVFGGSTEPTSDSQADVCWDIEMPSRETLYFLGQTLAELSEAEQKSAIEQLEWLKVSGSKRARKLAFEYGLIAQAEGYPAHLLASSVLDGLDFEGRWFGGQLGLSETTWRKCNLIGTRLDGLDLQRAVFDGAMMQRLELKDDILEEATFVGAELWGAEIRESTGDGQALVEANSLPAVIVNHGGQLKNPSTMPDTIKYAPGHLPEITRLKATDGHKDWVNAVAWAPGGLIASASDDSTVRVWEAASGKCLGVLEGHNSRVNSVAWAPDGLIASASDDSTVRVWEAASGQCLGVLEGHEGSVNSVAWGPDGLIASASEDGTVRVWDSKNDFALTRKYFLLPENEYAVSDENERIIAASTGAFRHLYYVGVNEKQQLDWWPLEAYGPLPVQTASVNSTSLIN